MSGQQQLAESKIQRVRYMRREESRANLLDLKDKARGREGWGGSAESRKGSPKVRNKSYPLSNSTVPCTILHFSFLGECPRKR